MADTITLQDLADSAGGSWDESTERRTIEAAVLRAYAAGIARGVEMAAQRCRQCQGTGQSFSANGAGPFECRDALCQRIRSLPAPSVTLADTVEVAHGG